MSNELFDYALESQTIPKKQRISSTHSTPQIARDLLFQKYKDKLHIKSDLTRSLVSFQSNKSLPFYRWMKYKEAFSCELVRYVLNKFNITNKKSLHVLDPFAGAGTTLTAATKTGWSATGIKLLPVGTAAIKARLCADNVDLDAFKSELNRLQNTTLIDYHTNGYEFPHVRITQGAFSRETEKAISAYMAFIDDIKNADVRFLFWFSLISILEEISFTRKDGQYLRWDKRSGRSLKSSFHKGEIPGLNRAIARKLKIIREDLENRNSGTFSQNVKVIEGSCLYELPKLPSDTFNLVMTSPPYCNRYDYTRTYALELAFLGYNEKAINHLRQTLLSATVENKTKQNSLKNFYDRKGCRERFKKAQITFNNQETLKEVLNILWEARERKDLNNNNIPIMVKNYFFEMNVVISELARVLSPGGHVIMVNDNVQYHGEEIPVDLILSDFAQSAGLEVDAIWILPKGKGNSSQQMGTHGRRELRKCVYVWSKPA